MKKHNIKFIQKGGEFLTDIEENIFQKLLQIKNQKEGDERTKFIYNLHKDLLDSLKTRRIYPPGFGDFLNLNKDTEMINPYEIIQNNSVFTPAFKKYMTKLTKIILDKEEDSIKFTRIGKAFVNFSCKKNEFRERFKRFLIDALLMRIYNKIILKKKLEYTLNECIREIGNCDVNFLSRNLPDCFKRTLGLMMKKITSEKSCSKPSAEDEKNIYATLILNQIRNDIVKYIEMYKIGIITDVEANNKKKINPQPSWLINPAFLAAAQTLVNGVITLSNTKPMLIKSFEGNDKIKEFIENTLKATTDSAASTILIFAGPLAVFAFYGTVNLLKQTSWYEVLSESKKTNNNFRKAVDYWQRTNGITSKPCGQMADIKDYVEKFGNASRLIQDYKDKVKLFDDTDTLFTISLLTYHIICQSEIIPETTEPAITEPAITEPAITEPAITEPTITEPAITEPTITEPAEGKITHISDPDAIWSTIQYNSSNMSGKQLNMRDTEVIQLLEDLRKYYLVKKRLECKTQISNMKEMRPLIEFAANNQPNEIENILCKVPSTRSTTHKQPGITNTGGRKSRKLKTLKRRKGRKTRRHN